MGYSIYYSRAFIRVGDQYVPLVCSGASNCADWYKGRLVSEKNWGVLNWNRRGQVLFSEPGIHEIAKDYERLNQEGGMCFKSRNRPFDYGEFEQWIIGGMKRAHTIDEYCSAGNTLNVVDYPNGMVERWRIQPFSTEEEMLNIIGQFGAGHDFDISFSGREITRPIRDTTVINTEKPSVLRKIAESREQGAATNKQKPDKPKKSRGEEL